ncbi:MAG: tetratricopeptide repeat protein [Bacteroidetes bacterium]|nr:MAG: tetratricopeptide repeat protein [Bacteroidota bacterium]
MKSITIICCFLIVASCSKSVDYSPEYIKQTSGRYLYSPDEVFEIYYENKKLFLNWRGVKKIKPVIIDQHTFFVADMYKKLRFVQRPNTKEQYVSIVNPDNEDLITYDYLKLADSFDIPSSHLKNENFDKALAGYLEIKKQDSTSILIDEGEFNRLGYTYLREKKYSNAISVFRINEALFPESSNVYDSLADAYLRQGDSLQAFNNYKIALRLDSNNKRAKHFVDAYGKKVN